MAKQDEKEEVKIHNPKKARCPKCLEKHNYLFSEISLRCVCGNVFPNPDVDKQDPRFSAYYPKYLMSKKDRNTVENSKS